MSIYILRKYPDVPFLVFGRAGIGQKDKGAGHSPGWITYGLKQKVKESLNYGGMDAWIWGYWGNVERNIILGDASDAVKKHFNVMFEMHEAAIDATCVDVKSPSISRSWFHFHPP
jgi:hypothetical protein